MRTRPREFNWLASTLALIAAGLPAQVALDYGYGPLQWLEIATSLAPLNWALMAVSAVCAWLALRASPWLLLGAPLFAFVLLWNNWVVADTGANGSPEWTLWAGAAGMLPFGLLVAPRVRRVLIRPGLRWWLTPARRRAVIEVAVRPVLADEWSLLRGATFDISEGGAYITPTGIAAFPDRARDPASKLGAGARCTVRLALNQFHVIQCGAEVVRRCEAAQGDYPPGFAVRFIGLDPWQREALALYVRRSLPELSA